MATMTHGTTMGSVADEIISFRMSETEETIDVTSMTQTQGADRLFERGLVEAEASVEAYGTVPALGAEVTIAAGGESVSGRVISREATGSVGGVITYSATVKLMGTAV